MRRLYARSRRTGMTARSASAEFSNASRDEIELVASDWIARRNGGLSRKEETELAGWLAQDIRHAEAYAAMEASWTTLRSMHQHGESRAMGDGRTAAGHSYVPRWIL